MTTTTAQRVHTGILGANPRQDKQPKPFQFRWDKLTIGIAGAGQLQGLSKALVFFLQLGNHNGRIRLGVHAGHILDTTDLCAVDSAPSR